MISEPLDSLAGGPLPLPLPQPDDELYEEIEEEVLVLLSFPDYDHTPYLSKATSITVSGLFTENPTCEIDGALFEGQHERTLGTRLIAQTSDSIPNTSTAAGAGGSLHGGGSRDPQIIGLVDKRVHFKLKRLPTVSKATVLPSTSSAAASGDTCSADGPARYNEQVPISNEMEDMNMQFI